MDFGVELAKRQISNLQIDLLRDDLVGQVLRASQTIWQKNCQTQANLFECPIIHKNKRRYFIPYLSFLLFKNKLQLRPLANHSQPLETNISHLLTMQEYQDHHRSLFKYKFTTVRELLTESQGETYTLDFDSWTKQKTCRRKFEYNLFLPRFFQTVISKIAVIEDDIDLTSGTISYTDHRYNPREYSITQFKFQIQPWISYTYDSPPTPSHSAPSITVWTDGSLDCNTSQAGYGIAYTTDYQLNEFTEFANQSVRIDHQYASSKTTEARAVFQALQYPNKETAITIKTDSKTTLDNIKVFSNSNTTLRQKLKVTDHHIIDQITQLHKDFENPPIFEWVKGHSGLIFNERADQLAKIGASGSNYQPVSAVTTPTIPIILHREGAIIGSYAATTIKADHYTKQRTRTRNRLDRLWPLQRNQAINHKATCNLAYMGLRTSNYLDSSKFRERAFRIKVHNHTLPVNSLVTTWKKYENQSNLCPRCKQFPENIHHLWDCEVSLNQWQTLRFTATTLMVPRQQTSFDFKVIKQKTFPVTPSLLLDALGATNSSFLKSNLARGIITHQDQHKFRNFILKHSKVADLNQSDILQWMNLALSCWMSSIYHNLWKHRNREQFD
jgi:ribonuclease HI